MCLFLFIKGKKKFLYFHVTKTKQTILLDTRIFFKFKILYA